MRYNLKGFFLFSYLIVYLMHWMLAKKKQKIGEVEFYFRLSCNFFSNTHTLKYYPFNTTIIFSMMWARLIHLEKFWKNTPVIIFFYFINGEFEPLKFYINKSFDVFSHLILLRGLHFSSVCAIFFFSLNNTCPSRSTRTTV